MQCLLNLVGLRGFCNDTEAEFYFDDIEGLGATQLAELATSDTETGKALAEKIIDSASRIMSAEIEGLIPPRYKIGRGITQVVSTCTFTAFTETAQPGGTGIIIKNTSSSNYSMLRLDSLTIRHDSPGEFTVKIKAGKTVKEIPVVLESGVDLELTGINFTTPEKMIRVFFEEPADLATISCPAESSCGCGSSGVKKDVQISGLKNGIEQSVQYGFLAGVSVYCSPENVLCNVVTSARKSFALALLYLCASKAFEENVLSQRINRTANGNVEQKEDKSAFYYELYKERMTGNKRGGITGIADIISASLSAQKDSCVYCDAPVNVAWAIG